MTERNYEHAGAVAVHEAGHFIVGLNLGLAPISARTDGIGSGVVKFNRVPVEVHTRDGCTRWVAVLLAGGLAERRAFGAPRLRAASDDERALKALMGLPTQAERIAAQTEAIRCACEILHRRWGDVQVIAEEIRDGTRAWGAAA